MSPCWVFVSFCSVSLSWSFSNDPAFLHALFEGLRIFENLFQSLLLILSYISKDGSLIFELASPCQGASIQVFSRLGRDKAWVQQEKVNSALQRLSWGQFLFYFQLFNDKSTWWDGNVFLFHVSCMTYWFLYSKRTLACFPAPRRAFQMKLAELLWSLWIAAWRHGCSSACEQQSGARAGRRSTVQPVFISGGLTGGCSAGSATSISS